MLLNPADKSFNSKMVSMKSNLTDAHSDEPSYIN